MTTPEDVKGDTDGGRARRPVRLAADDVPEPGDTSAPTRPATPAARPSPRDRLLRGAEHVVGDWAPTLFDALVRALVFAVVLVVLGLTLGIELAVVTALVGVGMFLTGRRRAGSGD